MSTPHTLSPDHRVRRVAHWRRALVAASLTATLGAVGLIGTQVAADAEQETPAVTTTTTSTTTDQGTSHSDGSSGLSSGSSGSSDATSSGS